MTIQTIRLRVEHAWASHRVRTVVLTLYYLGIIIGVAAVGAGRHPGHFVYQEF